jgi:thiamine-phosphate pyrophosphorylase
VTGASGAHVVRRPLDLSLCLVVGPDDTRGRPVRDVVLAAVAGGATIVQLRRKDHAARAFVEEARTLVAALRPRGVPLIVNDRVDVALAADADGVHVGQEDLPVADVRRLVGERMVVGLSITTLDEARALDPGLADYAGVGPVFATASKPDAAPALGLDGTRAVCEVLAAGARGLPAVAIGGIGPANAAAVRATGVAGVAVISAICAADDVRAAAASLAALMRGRPAVRRP